MSKHRTRFAAWLPAWEKEGGEGEEAWEEAPSEENQEGCTSCRLHGSANPQARQGTAAPLPVVMGSYIFMGFTCKLPSPTSATCWPHLLFERQTTLLLPLSWAPQAHLPSALRGGMWQQLHFGGHLAAPARRTAEGLLDWTTACWRVASLSPSVACCHPSFIHVSNRQLPIPSRG